MKHKSEVNLWYCSGCNVVHLAAGGMTLNFSRDEFAVFAESIVDIHYSARAFANDANQIFDLKDLLSSTVH